MVLDEGRRRERIQDALSAARTALNEKLGMIVRAADRVRERAHIARWDQEADVRRYGALEPAGSRRNDGQGHCECFERDIAKRLETRREYRDVGRRKPLPKLDGAIVQEARESDREPPCASHDVPRIGSDTRACAEVAAERTDRDHLQPGQIRRDGAHRLDEPVDALLRMNAPDEQRKERVVGNAEYPSAFGAVEWVPGTRVDSVRNHFDAAARN